MLPDFSRSVQTSTIMELLREAPIGAVVTYGKISEAIGEDVSNGARHHLTSAVKALYDEGLPFGTVRGEGVKRLTSEEIPAIGDHALLRIRRASRRARKRMGVVNGMNDVPNEVRVKVNTAASMLGVIENFAANKSRKAVEAEVEKVKGPIPPMKLLEALKG